MAAQWGKAYKTTSARFTRTDVMIRDLATHDRVAVYRCTEQGKASHKGQHIMYGRTVITLDDLEARCRRKGLNRMDQFV